MPRTLARLRYRNFAEKPTSFSRAIAQPKWHRPEWRTHLEKQVTAYVGRQSRPQQLAKLQVVVNPKARQQPTGQFVPAPPKPFTLKDIVDPAGQARHGEIIYIFRNNKTNQVIYSLQELLSHHHLEQLPFIGKHSKPPVLRPDEWVPHCVLTFPTAEQGHNAYRKLREFRKLHETSWQKTNPKWKRAPLNERIKLIMDQKANTCADIAEVLRIHEVHGQAMTEAFEEQQKQATEFMDKRWAEIDALANAVVAKEKDADNIPWLEHQIRSMVRQLAMRHNQNDADQRRLKNAKIILEIRLRKLQYAQRKAEQFKAVQEELNLKAAPANELGADGKLQELRDQATVLRKALQNPDPTRDSQELNLDREILAGHEVEIARLEAAFEAKRRSESRDHHIARSVLPAKLKKAPTPYTLEGISIRWADIRDALAASGQWPEAIEHEMLDLNGRRRNVTLMSSEDFEIETRNEASRILQALQPQQEAVGALQQ